MAASSRNFLSLLALTILAVSTFCTVILIFNQENVVMKLEYLEFYRIGSAVGATAVVFLLIYLTAVSSKPSAYKMFIMFLLMAGLIAEIVLMNVPLDLENISYGKYALVAFNFLYRTYSILEYIQEPWAELTFETINSGIQNVMPGDSSSSSSSAPVTDGSGFKAKWSTVAAQAKAKVGENFNGSLKGQGDQAVSKIISDGGPFTKGKLEELASQYLKNKDGSTIAGLDIPAGGRRRAHKRR